MKYYADLASALRARKCSEEQTLDVLRTVRETSAASGSTPEEEFGPAKEYAENFSGSRKFTVTRIVRAVSYAVAVIALITLRLTVLREVEFFPWGFVPGVAVFVAIGVTGDLIARWISRRLPQGFHEPVTA